ADVRRIAPDGFVVGRSVHTVEEAAGASGVDYLIAGTVFRSASKNASAPLVGVEGLRAIARAASAPVLAIGGVDEASLPDLAEAGASGCAAIGLFMASGDTSGSCRAVPLRAAVARWRERFDGAKNR